MGLYRDLVYKIARRWISGKEMGEALEGAEEANSRGLGVLLNYLGEDVTDLAVAQRHADEYVRLQRAISDRKIDGCVSVKLTQLGMLADEAFAAERVETLARGAEGLGQLFWIDMEGSKLTGRTLELYSGLFERHKNCGVALQSYLRSGEKDLKALLDIGARIRLVKGAYREPPDLAYCTRDEVDASFSKLMKELFERGDGFTIATHDPKLIDEAKRLGESHRRNFSFAMLKGIQEGLKMELVKDGYSAIDYMPYGEEWYAYSMRRIKEHPSNIWLLLRSFF